MQEGIALYHRNLKCIVGSFSSSPILQFQRQLSYILEASPRFSLGRVSTGHDSCLGGDGLSQQNSLYDNPATRTTLTKEPMTLEKKTSSSRRETFLCQSTYYKITVPLWCVYNRQCIAGWEGDGYFRRWCIFRHAWMVVVAICNVTRKLLIIISIISRGGTHSHIHRCNGTRNLSHEWWVSWDTLINKSLHPKSFTSPCRRKSMLWLEPTRQDSSVGHDSWEWPRRSHFPRHYCSRLSNQTLLLQSFEVSMLLHVFELG